MSGVDRTVSVSTSGPGGEPSGPRDEASGPSFSAEEDTKIFTEMMKMVRDMPFEDMKSRHNVKVPAESRADGQAHSDSDDTLNGQETARDELALDTNAPATSADIEKHIERRLDCIFKFYRRIESVVSLRDGYISSQSYRDLKDEMKENEVTLDRLREGFKAFIFWYKNDGSGQSVEQAAFLRGTSEEAKIEDKTSAR